MTTIYLIRHAEAEGNLYRRIHGWYNALITETGWKQIKALENRFRDIHIDAVWSSPLFRTMATARAVYLPKGLELHTDPDLREISFGKWEDRNWGEAFRNSHDAMTLFHNSDPAWHPPGGETFDQAGTRFHTALKAVAEQYPDQTVAVFSHGSVIRQLMIQLKKLPVDQWSSMPHFDNTAVTCLDFDGDDFTIRFEGDNSHLDQSISTFARQSWWRKNGAAKDVSLWFRPLELPRDQELLTLSGLCEESARLLMDQSPWGVSVGMSKEEPVGLVALDREAMQLENAGFIPRLYILPQRLAQVAAVQFIGHAVSRFRPLGRDKLFLCCPPEEKEQMDIWSEVGFLPAPRADFPELLEKYIGFDQ